MENKDNLLNNEEKLYYNESLEEFQVRVDDSFSKYDTSNLTNEEKLELKNKIADDIHQDNVNKILLNLVRDIKSLPQEDQDAFWGKK